MLSNKSASSFLITCLFLYAGLTQHHLHGNESSTLKRIYDRARRRTNESSNVKQIYDRKKRWSNYNYRTSCRFSQCTENRTIFETSSDPGCYCDEACYKIFYDCCPDYEEYCGPQELPPHGDSSLWECVKTLFMPTWFGYKITGATQVWMISKCPLHWRFKEMKTKCEGKDAPSNFCQSEFILPRPTVFPSRTMFRAIFQTNARFFLPFQLQVVKTSL